MPLEKSIEIFTVFLEPLPMYWVGNLQIFEHAHDGADHIGLHFKRRLGGRLDDLDNGIDVIADVAEADVNRRERTPSAIGSTPPATPKGARTVRPPAARITNSIEV